MRFSVTAGTSTGQPASKTANRPTLAPCSPVCVTAPVMTSSTLAGAKSGALDESCERLREQLIGTDITIRTPATSERRTNRFDDDGLTHGRVPVLVDTPSVCGRRVLTRTIANKHHAVTTGLM